MRGLTVGLAAFTALILPDVAIAQLNFQPSTATFGAVMGGQQAAIQEEIHKNDWGRKSAAEVSRPSAARPLVTTAYPSDPAVTGRVQRQFVAFVRTQSGAAGGEAMARAFASQDLLQAWARQARPDRMRLGDVADAMAEYWVTNWLIAHGRAESPPGTVAAVRDQVRGVLACSPAFGRLSPPQRQEMAEALIYNTLLQGELVGDAMKRRDAAYLARAADAAVARFRTEAGIHLRAVDLTARGLVRKG